jgi:hypothetical protein
MSTIAVNLHNLPNESYIIFEITLVFIAMHVSHPLTKSILCSFLRLELSRSYLYTVTYHAFKWN